MYLAKDLVRGEQHLDEAESISLRVHSLEELACYDFGRENTGWKNGIGDSGLSGAADEKRTREILRQGIASKIKWKIVGIIFRMFHKMYRYPREGRVL